MFQLHDYSLSKKLETSNYVLFEAVSKNTQTTHLIKSLPMEYASNYEIDRAKKEFKIAASLKQDSIIQYKEFFEEKNNLYTVLEFFDGILLSEYIKNYIVDLSVFSKVSSQLVDAIIEIHSKNLIHKDIRPINILINPNTMKIKIIDFGVASESKKEYEPLSNRNRLEGSLHYISPEQTGRMNHSLDYRTDFYSLGVCFYEMLTKQLPFDSADLLDIIHFHIARLPKDVYLINPNVSLELSNIVKKLLSKNPESRYKTGNGLKYDLENLPSELGKYDISPVFQIPEKLYGREKEIEILLNSFDGLHSSKFLFVSGYSGIGKSAIIKEIQKPLVREKGHFIAGKFDQLLRNIPYSGIIKALEDMVRQILAEKEDTIHVWKQKLQSTLGENGQVIINLIPDLEKIIGKQPLLKELDPIASQNRFNKVVGDLFRTLADHNSPLVLFLDDLQWADIASIRLLEFLSNDPDLKYCIFLGAYRDNEVDATHPLQFFITELEKSLKDITKIHLEPLSVQNICELLSDSLLVPFSNDLENFAELVFQKTGGNSFFVKLLLNRIAEEGFIYFANNSKWEWNLSKIQSLEITDNLVEIAVQKINKLHPETIELLKIASCIGNQFDLNLISLVTGQSVNDVKTIFLQAVQEDLIYVMFSDEAKELFKFVHDKIQQASYSLIPASKKNENHLKIGRLLFQTDIDSSSDETIFTNANQIHFGLELVKDSEERLLYSDLYLKAGVRAKDSAAYFQAYFYLDVAKRFLNETSWKNHYDLTLKINSEFSEAALLVKNYDVMKAVNSEVLLNAKTVLDKVRIYEIQLLYHSYLAELVEAVNVARDILEQLGVVLPKKPKLAHIFLYLFRAKIALIGKSTSDLENHKLMTDPKLLAASRIITSAASAAYFTSAEMLSCMFLKGVEISAKHGNSAYSAYFYSGYALLLCGALGDLKSGEAFGKLSLSLLDKFNANFLKCRTTFVYHAFTSHWTHPLKQSLSGYIKAYEYGISFGDVEYATGNILFYAMSSLNLGNDLNFLDQEMESFTRFIERSGLKRNLNVYLVIRQFIQNMLAKSEDPEVLTGFYYDEEKGISEATANNDVMAVCWIYLYKAILSYILGNNKLALETIEKIHPFLPGILSQNLIPLFHFYESLILLENYDPQNSASAKFLKRIKSNLKKLKSWGSMSPENTLHKAVLVEARLSEFTNPSETINLYNSAIQISNQNSYPVEQAIACELAARFCLKKDWTNLVKSYLRDAEFLYQKWGATAKIRLLHKEFQGTYLLPNTNLQYKSFYNAQFDITSILKSTEVFASEIVLEELLTKLMQILAQNAGATNGCLVLYNGSAWEVGAEFEMVTIPIRMKNRIPLSDYQNISPLVVQYVIRMKTPLILKDPENDTRFARDPHIQELKPKSILCIPLLHKATLIGVLYLENTLTNLAFTEERLEAILIITSQAAISIENAKLVDDIVKSNELLEEQNTTLEIKVQERTLELQTSKNIAERLLEDLRSDLLVAKKIQQNILPKSNLISNHLHIETKFLPMNEVGGDLYDITKVSETYIRIFIADATGHGVQAALLTMSIKAEYENLKNSNKTPSEILKMMNQEFYKKYYNLTTFFSCCVLDIDLEKKQILFSSAGHPPQHLIKKDKIILLEKQGRLIGMRLDATYKDIIHPILPEDKIFLFTDGAYEQFSSSREEYGEERLLNLVQSSKDLGGLQVLNTVLSSVMEFSSDKSAQDDITMIWLEIQS